METRQIILIAEDESLIRKIICKNLADSYTVLEAEDGMAAWEILSARKTEIAAVLLDIKMPVMDGYAVLEKMQQAHMDDMPVVVMTSDEGSEQRALDAGAWDFIAKPFNPKILLSRLKNAIARSQITAFEKMRYLSEHDELTGLYNRRKMFAETQKMLDEHPDISFVFVRLDIDHFALFNTSFGEKEGDELLKFVAGTIVEAVSACSHFVCGRMNADVFCLAVSWTGNIEALGEMVESVQRKMSAYREDYSLELSIGICRIEDRSLSVDDYFLHATMAAQMCKNQYNKHFAFYDESVGHRLASEIAITAEMQRALDEEQFCVYLQPKFNLSKDAACGAEALVRWLHPQKGVVSPGEFIPVFERNGFIAKLDYFVWEKTCRLLRSWLDAGKAPHPISVNISRISLYNPNLTEQMTGLTKKYCLPPSLLQLEITESAYMSNPDLMRNTITSLHEAGFTILMDDFGSGYSSLNTLKEIDVDVLKVDMKFLPVEDEVERAEIILACVIKMANWLGMSVVVEGVETRRQRDFLEGAGCDYVQGYFYSRPIPHAEYEAAYVYRAKDAQDTNDVARSDGTPQYNITILIIDDNEFDRVVLYENLHEMYHLHMCESAESALAYLKRNAGKVRLILVDNIMPGMSGLEFLRYCRQDAELSVIPKIMITASDTNADQVDAFNNGAYDYITKPLTREIVLARVNHVMELSYRTPVFDPAELRYPYKNELDPDTKLLNKIVFRRLATHILESSPDDMTALLMIDIDSLKNINDAHGHLSGDEVIRRVVGALNATFRQTDIQGRFGGDEFFVLMTKLSSVEVARRKASEVIKSVMFICTGELHIDASVSVGIALSMPGDTFDTLFSRADQALYEAKHNGRACCVVYGETVPPINNDESKPVVLVCSTDAQLFPTIALSYGNEASFAGVTSYEELVRAFDTYQGRLATICLDMAKKAENDSDAFYDYILAHGGGEQIPIVAVCHEGDMEQLRQALRMHVRAILALPPAPEDMIRRTLSKTIMDAVALKTRPVMQEIEVHA